MNNRLAWLTPIVGLALVSPGCGEEQLPPTTYPGASREMMEKPTLYAAKIKALKEGKDINSVKLEAPTKQMTSKQKEAYEKAQAAIDPREAAKLKMQKEQEAQK